jgi:UDP-glucose 4-epimerase
MSNRFLITGANGYIGKYLTTYLKKNKIDVYGCDKKGFTEKKFIKSDFSSDKVIDFIKLNKINHIIHLAAITTINDNKKNSIKCHNNNYIKSRIFLQKLNAKKIKIKKFIFSSSAAVYGLCKNHKIKENFKPNPISAYGKSKYMFEVFLKKEKLKNLSNVCVLRFFNIVGGNLLFLNDKKTLLNKLYLANKKNRTFYINGNDNPTKDGTNIRDFIDLEILSQFILLIIQKDLKKKYLIFNVGSGIGKSILEIIDQLNKNNFKIKYLFKKRKSIDIPHSISDNTKMLNLLRIKRNKLDIFTNLKIYFTK